MTPTEIKDHAFSLLAWVGCFILVIGFWVIVFLIVQSIHANATECQSEQGDKGYWQWRYIKPHEHKRCWYHGRRRLPKEDLYWSIMKPEKKQHIDPVFPPDKSLSTPPGKNPAVTDVDKGVRADDPPTRRGAAPTIKIVKESDYTELDALADKDPFFDAKPMTFWPSVTPFTPWTERVAGAFQ